MKVYLKVHKAGDREVVAICDENLVGRCFREKNLKLEVSERFYKGKIISKSETIEFLKEAHTVNLVGEVSVALGVEANIIVKDNVIRIGGIPHAISIQYE